MAIRTVSSSSAPKKLSMSRKFQSQSGLRLISFGISLVLAAALIAWAAEAQNTTAEQAPAQADAGPAPKFVGSTECMTCHPPIADPWLASPHGRALMQEGLPAERRGCEACHGPGGAHIGGASTSKMSIPTTADPVAANSLCGSCHFNSEPSTTPNAAPSLSKAYWTRSTHGRKELSCLSCHSGHPNANEKALVKPAKDLCLSCHASVMEDSPGKPAAYTHSPVAQGQCMLCHDPHGAADRRMVKADVNKACETCHDATTPKMTAGHLGFAVKGAKCISCHDPHSHKASDKLMRTKQHMPFKQRNCAVCHGKPGADGAATLAKPAKELCSSCHSATSIMKEGEQAHTPAKEGLCVMCHDPHASNAKGLQKTRIAYACFTCHSKIESDTLAAHKHGAYDGNMDCTACHKPHSSPQEKLLVKGESDLCAQCHKHSGSHPMGLRADGTPVIDPNTDKPMVCASCHNLHGSQFAILAKADKGRDLCLLCHTMEHR